MRIVERPSPNHNERRGSGTADMLVLHYTGMRSAAAALERLCDPAARVSAHYCVDEDGTIYRLVPEDRRAWHAGVGSWAGATDINALSIGIELVNPGHEFGYRPFPDAQMDAVTRLCQEILVRQPIPARRVLGHSDVAPARKEDPGELFDWTGLAAAGVGLYPMPDPSADAVLDIRTIQTQLQRFGYGIEVTGTADAQTATVLRAFQRHFRPGEVSGIADRDTAARLKALLILAGEKPPTLFGNRL